jgi:hypothetical protein
MKFRTTLLTAGKTATGIHVPDEVVESFGAGKRPAVSVTLKGYTYRSTIAVMDGRYMVGVSADVRAAAGVAGGDALDVNIELDNAPREIEVPADFAAALKKDAKAKRFFDGLTYSQKRWHVSRIEGAKKAETRERRIVDSVQMLSEGRVP